VGVDVDLASLKSEGWVRSIAADKKNKRIILYPCDMDDKKVE
jgi:hypothetical protein